LSSRQTSTGATAHLLRAAKILLVPEPGSLTILLIACGLLAGRFHPRY
jgi:hypothetical protein